MRKISLLWCVLLCFAFIFVSYADDEPQHSIIAASFTYHFYPTGKHNQYFNNEFIVNSQNIIIKNDRKTHLELILHVQ